MNLNVENWKEFLLSDYFDIVAGKYHYPNEYDIGDTPYISASNENNGVAQKIDLVADFHGNCIVTGKVGCTAFYQPNDFCATSDVNVFYPRFRLNERIGLFIVTVINFNENYKWGYGRQCRVGDSKEIIVKLPSTADNIPDWDFMEQYIKSLNHKPIATANRGGYGSHTLGVETWKDFCLGDYFEIKKGKRLTSDEQTEGSTPYIGAIDSNNGIANYIGQDAIHEGNTISLSYNGSVGEAFYQPRPFWATDDVNVLYFREENGVAFNKYIALFVCAVLRQEKYRYSYGRKWVLESMKSTVIKLPEKSGKPDWLYMEYFIKNLPYGDKI